LRKRDSSFARQKTLRCVNDATQHKSIATSFVRGIGVHREDEVIARGLSLGHAFGFSAVAEGVAPDAQLAFLRHHGCSAVQGYRFAQPTPAADAHTFIRDFNAGTLALG
jgi:EAL domain-containing protein (putative c-di-GMP-specific phosphodiesterase class I)